jgi:hypothetical protein
MRATLTPSALNAYFRLKFMNEAEIVVGPLVRKESVVSQSAMHRLRSNLLALSLYQLIAIVFFGRPLLIHLGSRIAGQSSDPGYYIWCFVSWPHALAHHLNPFLTHFIWAPDGFNVAYAGLPLLAVAVVFLRSNWKLPSSKFLTLMVVTLAVGMLGRHLRVGGYRSIKLPWLLVTKVPFLNSAVPARLALYFHLVPTLIVACWLAETHLNAVIKWTIAGAIVVSLLPNPDSSFWVVPARIPNFLPQRPSGVTCVRTKPSSCYPTGPATRCCGRP